MHKRLVNFLTKFDLLTQDQFGFQKHKSTSDATLKLVDSLYTSLKNKSNCCAIFLDLAKAFDTVDHKILLGKLDRYGIRGNILNWFSSYLHRRMQCVNVNGTLFDPVEMLFGVPQGSVLGPLLFLIYVNDLPSITDKFDFTLFADDTCLLAKHNSLIELNKMVNEEIIKINDWLIDNKLSLLFTGNLEENNFVVTLNGTNIARSRFVKYLDDKLTWDHHVDHVLLKVR